MLYHPRWRKVFRDLWRNKLRTLLIVLAIAVGVFMSGVMGISQSILKSELNAVYMATNPAHIEMTISPFDDDLLNAVRGMREVAYAEARALFAVSLQTGPDEWITTDMYAVEDFDAVQLSKFVPDTGSWPPARREVLFERSMLRIPGFAPSPGDLVNIELPDGREEQLTMGGTVHDVARFPAHYFRDGVGYIDQDTYAWLTGSNSYNRLYIQLAENVDDKTAIEQTAKDIKERIEHYGYNVYGTFVPEPGVHWNAYSYDALTLILTIVGLFSLLLTVFLIVNTMSAVLRQQVRQIGMMKAVGGRTGQIVAIYLSMVLIFGLLSLVIAIPAARLVARSFVDFAASLTNFEIQNFRVEPWVVALQVALAVLLPLAAGLFPVLAGANVTTHQALSDYGIGRANPDGLIDRLIQRVHRLPRPLLLSLRNTFRRKGRLLLTLITLTLAGSVFISVFSLRQALYTMIGELIELFSYDLGIYLGEPVPTRRIERETMRVPGVVYVEAWTLQTAHYIRPDGTEGVAVAVYGVPVSSAFITPLLEDGQWLGEPGSHDIVVQANLLNMEGLSLGENIVLDMGEYEATWRIVGEMTATQNTGNDAGIAYVIIDDMRQVLNIPGQTSFVTIRTTGHDMDSQFRTLHEVEEHFKQIGIPVASSYTMSQNAAGADIAINVLVSLLLSTAILLAFVGGLGLAGTMSLNVIERTREIGVLRSLGASDRSVFGIVVVEGMLIGLLGALMSALLAVPLGKGLNVMVGQVIIQTPLDFAYSLPGLGIWLALSMVISAAASFLPARSAARLSVRETLAYE